MGMVNYLEEQGNKFLNKKVPNIVANSGKISAA